MDDYTEAYLELIDLMNENLKEHNRQMDRIMKRAIIVFLLFLAIMVVAGVALIALVAIGG